MTRPTCILCPVDFSEFSQHAIGCAVRLSRSTGSRIVALHVFANWPAVDVGPSLRSDPQPTIFLKDVDRDMLTGRLEEFVRTAAKGVEIDARVVEAPNVPREIVAQAEALHAGLIDARGAA